MTQDGRGDRRFTKAKAHAPEGARVTERYYDITFLMKEFGLTEQQARHRVATILPVLEKLGCPPMRGDHNRLLFNEESVEIFRQAMELERSGMTWQKVIDRLKSELQPYSLGELRRHYESQIEVLKRQIQILEQQLDFLRRQNEDLREMLRKLMERAAPVFSAEEPAKEKPPTA
jgi:DNA-binding transcriptional MerR regulator